MDTELVSAINQSLSLSIPDKISADDLQKKIADLINGFIQHDFNSLITVLYKVDVNETKLKKLLQENPGEDAGKIITALIIERQLQKIKSRRESKSQQTKPTDEEAW